MIPAGLCHAERTATVYVRRYQSGPKNPHSIGEMKNPIFPTFAVLLSLAPMQAVAANLITNGSFENKTVTGSSAFTLASGDNTSLPGWVVSGPCTTNCVLLLSNQYFAPPLTFSTQQGTFAMDLTGVGNSFTGGIYQTVDTLQGSEYQLSFYVGNFDDNTSGFAGPESVELLLDNTSQGIFTNSGITPLQVTWMQVTLSFMAAGEHTKIEFRNATENSGYAGLDLVTLEGDTVPEPGTWMLLTVALLVPAMIRHKAQPTSDR